MLKSWNLLILVIIATFAVAFAACGDDDDGGNPSATGTASATGSRTPKPSSPDGSSPTPAGSQDPDETPGDDETPDGATGTSATSTDPAATTPPDEDAECELLTEEDLADVIDSRVNDTTVVPGACSYTFDDLTSVGLSVADLGDNGEQVFDLSQEFLSGEPVTDLGDRAFWVEDFNQLYVRVGSTQVFVTMQFAGDVTDAKALAIGLAEKIVDRLDQ